MFTVSRPKLIIKCSSNDKKKPKYTKYKDIKKTSEKEKNPFNMKGFFN